MALHNSDMPDQREASPPAELPLRPQDEVECRRCDVHCDKVVHPGTCVERDCPFLYAFEEVGHTYVGCMQKVFDVEIDLDLLIEAEASGGFGAVRAAPRHAVVPGVRPGQGERLALSPRRDTAAAYSPPAR